MRVQAAERPNAVVQAVQQDRAGLLARLEHVVVGREPVGGEHVDQLDQARRDVAMQVHARRDQAIRANMLADRCCQVALGVVHALHVHRAVDVQVEAVERQRRPNALQ